MRYALVITFLSMIVIGCAGPKITMPQMDLPPEPIKPKIQSVVIPRGEQMYIGYSISDSLKLYEFLLRKDSYEEKLRYRIEAVNQLLQGK